MLAAVHYPRNGPLSKGQLEILNGMSWDCYGTLYIWKTYALEVLAIGFPTGKNDQGYLCPILKNIDDGYVIDTNLLRQNDQGVLNIFKNGQGRILAPGL